MRLILAVALCLGVAPVWAGESLIVDPPAQDSGSAAVAPPTRPRPAPAVENPRIAAPAETAAPYAGISDAPLFGRIAAAAAKVDESALRFYAAQKDRTRVDAEIKRLTMLHPAWKPPANLYAVGDGRDEQPLWDLYAAGRFDDVRLAIRNRERQEPGWRPSADLLAKLERREAAKTVETLARAKQWTKVLELANAHPDMVACSGMEVSWRVVEAFVGAGLPQRAFDVDAAILTTCKDRHDRLATVRKAVGVLSPADVERLIAMGAVLADGSREFDPVRLDLARQLIGDLLAHAQHADVPAETLSALSDATMRSGDAADAGLLGWYQFSRENWAEADGWFKLGLTGTAGDVKLAEGHALSLSKLGRTDEAVQLAAAWRDHSDVMRRLFVDLFGAKLADRAGPPVEAGMLADYSTLLVADKNVAGAQALAWHDFDLKDWAGALDWFDRAASWVELAQPGTAPPEKVLEGTILALRNVGRVVDGEDMAFKFAPVSQAARELTVSLAISTLSTVAPAPAITAARLDRMTTAIRTARSSAGAAALGWRQLREGRAPTSVDWFRTSLDWTGDKAVDLKVIEGLVLALQTAGRLKEAEQEAYPHIDESNEIMAAYRAVMVARLTGPGRGTDIGSDRLSRFADIVVANRWSDGAEALGWYRVKDLDCGYALDWFRAATAWSSDPAGSPKAAEGYAQALEGLGDDLGAADLALQWAPRSPEMKALYASAMAAAITRPYPVTRIAEARLAPFADLVRTDHLVNGAQALAWYRYRDAGNGYGVEWFAQALEWLGEGSADAKTVEGYGAALRDLGRLGDAEEVLFPWVDRVPAMRDMYLGVVVSELTLDDPPEPLPAARLVRFAEVATPIRSAKAAQALGWYRLARHEYADGVTWFKNAIDWWPQTEADADRAGGLDRAAASLVEQRQPGPIAMRPEDYRRSPRAFSGVAQDRDRQASRETATAADLATTVTGYVLALRGAGRDLEAEDAAFAWRERSPQLARLFVDLALDGLARTDATILDPARLKRYSDVIEALRSPAGAAGLAWSSFKREDWTEAAIWFKAAIDWRAPQSTPDPKLVGGYVDALRRAGRTEEAFAVAANWRDSGPEFRATYLGVAFEVLGAAGQPGSVTAASLRPDQLADIVAMAKADPSKTGAGILGWYYYGTRNPVAALAAFKSAIERSGVETPDPKAIEGLALSLRAANRTEDALTFISAWQERIPSLRETVAGMTIDLLGRKDAVGLAPDLVGRLAALATAQTSATSAGAFGWYFYGRQDWSGAARWFRNAMEWSPDHAGPDKMLEGYALSLRNLCRFDEAESLVAARMDGPEHAGLRALYVDAVGDQLARAAQGRTLSALALQRFAAAVVAESSASGAQNLGWYSFRAKQFAAARAWFERSAAWHPTEAAAFGLAMTARKLADADELADVALRYGPEYPIVEAVRRVGIGGRDGLLPRLDEVAPRRGVCGSPRPTARGQADTSALLELMPTPQRAVRAGPTDHMGEALALALPGVAAVTEARAARKVAAAVSAIAEPVSTRSGHGGTGDAAAALNAKDYSRCLALLDRGGGSRAGDAQQIRGWCLLGLDRAAEAAEAFRAARGGARERDASGSAVGEALSLLRVGDTGAAIAAASRSNLSAEQRATVGAQVLGQQAYAAYKAERWRDTMELLNRRAALASETRDLTMLRGWALYQSGDYDDSRQVFTTLDQRLSDPETRKALAVVTNASQPKARQ